MTSNIANAEALSFKEKLGYGLGDGCPKEIAYVQVIAISRNQSRSDEPSKDDEAITTHPAMIRPD